LTKETLDSDGWLATGDVGMWDSKGRLVIIDRKKSLLKLSQGEYIAPEKIESAYVSKSSLISSCFVWGDSLRNHLVAVVIPDRQTIMAWAKGAGLDSLAWEDLCRREELRKALMTS
jgi:long-chain acyl-CoA synthetase